MNRKNRLALGTLAVLAIPGCVLFATYRDFLQAQHNFALFQAITSNDTRVTLSALNAGADANARYSGVKPPSLRDSVQRLLAKLLRRNTGMSSEPRTSALMYVFEGAMDTPDQPQSSLPHIENSDIVKALLEHGADPNVRSNFRMTPLMRAALLGYTDSQKILLQHGADIHAKDEDGETALHSAATATNAESVRLLLAKGADIDAQGKDGETPLMLAAYHDRATIVQVLLSGHANLNCKDKSGYTALDDALQLHADDVAGLLRKAGAKASATTAPLEPAQTGS